MSCDCRAKANAALAPHNTKIEPIFSINPDGPLSMPWPISTVQVEKGRGKKRAMGLFASYCPLCGVSLKEPKAHPAPAGGDAGGS